MILLTGTIGTIGRATMAALRAANAAFMVAARNPAELDILGVRTEPGIILGRVHFAAEREIRVGGIGWTMLFRAFFMDNFAGYHCIDPHKDSQIYLLNGDGKAAWVDPADVGEVAAKVLCTGSYAGNIIDLAGPALLSTAEARSVLGSVLDQRHTYVDVSGQAALEAMEKAGMPARLADAFVELNALIRQGKAATLTGGVQQVLGRLPRSMREWAARPTTAPGTA